MLPTCERLPADPDAQPAAVWLSRAGQFWSGAFLACFYFNSAKPEHEDGKDKAPQEPMSVLHPVLVGY